MLHEQFRNSMVGHASSLLQTICKLMSRVSSTEQIRAGGGFSDATHLNVLDRKSSVVQKMGIMFGAENWLINLILKSTIMLREDSFKFLVNVDVKETPASSTGRRSIERAWFHKKVPLLPCREAATQGTYFGNSSDPLQHNTISKHSRVPASRSSRSYSQPLQEHSQRFVETALSIAKRTNFKRQPVTATVKTAQEKPIKPIKCLSTIMFPPPRHRNIFTQRTAVCCWSTLRRLFLFAPGLDRRTLESRAVGQTAAQQQSVVTFL